MALTRFPENTKKSHVVEYLSKVIPCEEAAPLKTAFFFDFEGAFGPFLDASKTRTRLAELEREVRPLLGRRLKLKQRLQARLERQARALSRGFGLPEELSWERISAQKVSSVFLTFKSRHLKTKFIKNVEVPPAFPD